MVAKSKSMMTLLLNKIIFTRPVQTVRAWLKPYVYFFFKDLHKKTFLFNGKKYHYFTRGTYNNPWKNERAVEVALAMDLIKKYKGKNILEVGSVLGNYMKVKHDVVDKYDKEQRVINEDIVDYKPRKKYDLIICLSTLEHIGWNMGEETDGQDPNKSIDAIIKMRELLAKKGMLMVTVPLGYNPHLDKLFLKNKLPFTKKYFLKRTSLLNYWKQVEKVSKKDMNYGVIIMSAKLLLFGVIEKN